MSALTDKIVAEHRIVHLGHVENVDRFACEGCDWRATVLNGVSAGHSHIAAVTEAAVREQVARDIEAFIDGGCDCLNTCSCGASDAYRHAARIARGDVA